MRHIGAILFGNKTKVPLNDIRDLSVGDVEVLCGGENDATHQVCIFTMKAGRLLKWIEQHKCFLFNLMAAAC